MHLLPELPFLIFYLVDRTLGGQAPSCADAVSGGCFQYEQGEDGGEGVV